MDIMNTARFNIRKHREQQGLRRHRTCLGVMHYVKSIFNDNQTGK